MIRQPIVSVLGHVDHGKTTLLDTIRGSGVAKREAGGITQHIGATEVPLEEIYRVCGSLIKKRQFEIPGLLFIDTPGHHSFSTLRARGGALADIAILIVDINEGFKPQTIEALNILKRAKTPFVVAANKIDRIPGWQSKGGSFIQSYAAQKPRVQELLDTKIYDLMGVFSEHDLISDRYDRITDFTQNIAIVPVAALSGEGIPDLLMILIGLAQRFLSDQLETTIRPGEGTVLEIRDEKGIGMTLNAIIFDGVVRQGDMMVVGGKNGAIVTKIRAILKPKPMDEIRDPRDRFTSLKEVVAAAGVKLAAPDLDSAMAGTPIKIASKETLEDVIALVERELTAKIETQEDGLVLKADTLGSLEALASDLSAREIPIMKADVGDVSRRDIVDASTARDPLYRALFAFNVNLLPDAEEEYRNSDITLFQSKVIYQLIEDYEEWVQKTKDEMERLRRQELAYPAVVEIMQGCIFRVSKPAIVGLRIISGRIRPGTELVNEAGTPVGRIKNIQDKNENLDEALPGQEVAVSIEGAVAGKTINEEQTLCANLTEPEGRRLLAMTDSLSDDECDALDSICHIKRKQKPFWGK